MESQEKVKEDARVIHGGVAKGKLSVCVVHKGKIGVPNNLLKHQVHNKQKHDSVSNQTKSNLVCFGCGRPGHRVYLPECPVKQATCSLCDPV